jgi:hypothetical protein
MSSFEKAYFIPDKELKSGLEGRRGTGRSKADPGKIDGNALFICDTSVRWIAGIILCKFTCFCGRLKGLGRIGLADHINDPALGGMFQYNTDQAAAAGKKAGAVVLGLNCELCHRFFGKDNLCFKRSQAFRRASITTAGIFGRSVFYIQHIGNGIAGRHGYLDIIVLGAVDDVDGAGAVGVALFHVNDA